MTETEKNRSAMEKALELRSRLKKKRPEFARQECWRYKRVKRNWRRPKGLDSKMRKNIKGWPATVKVGYRGPKAVRGLHPSGNREVSVHNVNEVGDVDPETQAIRIAHTVGRRKRGKIIAEARKRNIEVLNFRELEKTVKEEEVSVIEHSRDDRREVKSSEEKEIKNKRKTGGGTKGNDDKS